MSFFMTASESEVTETKVRCHLMMVSKVLGMAVRRTRPCSNVARSQVVLFVRVVNPLDKRSGPFLDPHRA